MERGGVVCQAGERHKQRPRGKTPLEWSGTGVGLSPGVAGLSKAATAVKVRGQLICRALNAQLGRLEYVRGIREPEEEQMRRALLGVQSPEKPQIYLAETGRVASKMGGSERTQGVARAIPAAQACPAQPARSVCGGRSPLVLPVCHGKENTSSHNSSALL